MTSVGEAQQLGLTSAEARLRLNRDGPNSVVETRRPAPVRLLVRQLTHFFALLLWMAALLALVAGMPQLAVAIALVVVVNGTFAFLQEYRADRAADRLRDLMPLTARIMRDGRWCAVAA